MTGYIMESDREGDRLAAKTELVLVRRHLDWTGLAAGESFLDAGCGTGIVVAEAARLIHPGVACGFDASSARIDDAARQCRQAGLDNVRLYATPLENFASSRQHEAGFDHVWTRFFLEYQPDAARTVRTLARLAKPGGKVTLIDLEGNCTWHYGMQPALRAGLDEVIGDLATTGFDPHAGRRLTCYAAQAGLTDIRHEIEPYHRIVGTPDARTEAAWVRKIETIRDAYINRLFPAKSHLRWVFDELVEFLRSPDTMTWSLLHLVQGTKTRSQ